MASPHRRDFLSTIAFASAAVVAGCTSAPSPDERADEPSPTATRSTQPAAESATESSAHTPVSETSTISEAATTEIHTPTPTGRDTAIQTTVPAATATTALTTTTTQTPTPTQTATSERNGGTTNGGGAGSDLAEVTSAEYITPTAEDETPLQGVLYAEVENASDSTIYVTAEGRLASGTGQTQQTKEKSICPLVPGGNWELFFEAGGDASAQSIAEGDVVIAEAGAVDFPAPSGQVRVTGSNFTDQGMFEGAVENTDTESAQVTVLARALSESATTVGTRLVTTLGEVSSGEQAGFKFPAEQGRPNTLVPYSLLTYQIEPYTGNQNLSEFPGLSVE